MSEDTRTGPALAPAWLSLPDDVNRLDAKLWARDVARDDSGELAVAGVSASRLAGDFGTPLMVVSEADFRARARSFKQAFDAAFADLCGGVDVYYAGKSFLCTEVARWVQQEGLHLDTCTGGELAVASRADIPGRLLGLHGNNKSDAEIHRALDMDVGRIIVDSLDELERLAAIAAQRGATAQVMLRLTPGVHASTHEFIATAHEDQKFGLSLADDGGTSPAARAVAAALAAGSIELRGVHCHIGSQIFEPEGFAVAAERLLGFLADVQAEHGTALPELDLGGGYGIAYTEADTPRPPADIAGAMAAVVRDTCASLQLAVPRISIEPGRAISGPAGFTLYRAGTTKTVQVDAVDTAAVPQSGAVQSEAVQPGPAGRRYISVDGGMSDNARPVLYDADYSAVLARASSSRPELSRVVGKHCESGDIVVRDAYLPADTTRDDLIAVPATGAYCWALASNYNYVPRPPVVAVADGAARLIIRGETEDDLLARDCG
ncbi:diaminopimelate decarboxylase [Arthrobacter castelli]|uniref:diaminopimelate decarboxylase n=1 Tax=Arthrobacter castelli TaxID=271431 RepID=UPI0003F9CF75|nr:diaminopimelate decarboxylase [Arthrobacter castelli]